ncbi:ORF151 [Betabaculovirus altermyunipunctae]|uniref:ORF151 n=1 Tax=Betabaculovirus altermyunipunctae TaxID=3051996 RepID=A0A1S5YEF0_9BBAC|nr:ORF151 [Betabaculovirus altermyunipunctae]AQQ80417.1 ORF151 [Betabaculovirus altermyunipunctae]
MVGPNKLINLSFRICLTHGLKVFEYMPARVVDRLLSEAVLGEGVLTTTEMFKRIVMDYAYRSGEFWNVLRYVLVTDVCRYVEEMVDDEERVDDAMNSRHRWTFEDVFDVVVFVKIRNLTNTQHGFYEYLSCELLSHCKFCVGRKELVYDVRLWNADDQFVFSEMLFDLKNYCTVCCAPLYKLTRVEWMYVCTEEWC